MFLQKPIQEHIISRLSGISGSPLTLKKTSPIGGGCINEAYRFETSSGNFFVKLNSSSRYPGMFEAEEKGLRLLAASGAVGVPAVFQTGAFEKTSFFLAEFLESGAKIPGFDEDFGSSVAGMHKKKGEAFGLDHDNYIGSLPQSNRQHKSWSSFFIEERLEKQLKLARDNHKADSSLSRRFEKLYLQLDQIFPEEAPSLLHGDLWSGNYMCGPDGKAWLIDPAVYYGFREMDIAMSKLFGGFGEGFYKAYHAEYPLEKDWQERVDVCNLYPLMVHVNLFGRGYLAEVLSILRRY